MAALTGQSLTFFKRCFNQHLLTCHKHKKIGVLKTILYTQRYKYLSLRKNTCLQKFAHEHLHTHLTTYAYASTHRTCTYTCVTHGHIHVQKTYTYIFTCTCRYIYHTCTHVDRHSIHTNTCVCMNTCTYTSLCTWM